MRRSKPRSKKIKKWLAENDDKPGSKGTAPEEQHHRQRKREHEDLPWRRPGLQRRRDGGQQTPDRGPCRGDRGFRSTKILEPMVEGTRENFQTIGKEEDIFKKAQLTADSGFHSEKNMEMVIDDGIDAYIADNKFRHRDPRYATADRHKERFNKEIAKKFDRPITFQPRDFTVSPDKSFSHLPCREADVQMRHRESSWTACDQVPRNKTRLYPVHAACAVPEESRGNRNPPVFPFHRQDQQTRKDFHTKDAGEDRFDSRQAYIWKKDGDGRTGICRHPIKSRPGSIQSQRQKKGQHPVAAVLRCSQPAQGASIRVRVRMKVRGKAKEKGSKDEVAGINRDGSEQVLA